MHPENPTITNQYILNLFYTSSPQRINFVYSNYRGLFQRDSANLL